MADENANPSGSMLTEVKVFQELGLKGDPPKFNFDRDGKSEHIIIHDYANTHGERGLLEFLRTAQPTGKNARPYGEHYTSFYNLYSSNFQNNKSAVDEYITRWAQSGHKRDEI
jgi:hypothetical protein